ncbi:hypothetical protein CBR59_29895 [Bacillus thuringiensis]|uniref:hypothetical protein n=1 Tax=Bacillus cereus group TaxID=86661 RepID=UPI000B4BE0AA|nr:MULTISPECIES: hypothetical protein [Bacillus cereus group]PNK22794.1 hypothetical protein CBP87_30240 [Bacillus thuringiensis]PNK46439.1 hypothetical protein CBR59_29895 [Bacillus thuringiensis]
MPGKIINQTNEVIVIYGPKSPTTDPYYESYDNTVYHLEKGKTSPNNWDCDGFYVPSNRKVRQSEIETVNGPIAVNIDNEANGTITQEGDTYIIDSRVLNTYPIGSINWFIPDYSYEKVEKWINGTL